MRQVEKVGKKFQIRIPFILDPGKKIPKKIAKKFKKLKHLFPELFLAKTGRDRPRKREKKNLVLNSVRTKPGEENFEQNFSPKFRSYPSWASISQKKSKKIKNNNSDAISIQTGMRQGEKERKKFQSRIPFIFDPRKKIPKKIEKKYKK